MNAFPVTVQLPDGGRFETCRMVSTGDSTAQLWAWVDGAPAMIAEGTIEPTGARSWQVTTDDGVVLVDRQSGCACGHPMKRWRPAGRAPRVHTS